MAKVSDIDDAEEIISTLMGGVVEPRLFHQC